MCEYNLNGQPPLSPKEEQKLFLKHSKKINALQTYNEATFIIESILYDNNLFTEKPKLLFNVEDLLCKFDALLQYSMMQCAIWGNENGNYNLYYIKNLPKRYGFCEYLNKCGYYDVNWSDILNTSYTALVQFPSTYLNDMSKLSDEFVSIIKYTELKRDYTQHFNILKRRILNIMQTISTKKVSQIKNYKSICLVLQTVTDLRKILVHDNSF